MQCLWLCCGLQPVLGRGGPSEGRADSVCGCVVVCSLYWGEEGLVKGALTAIGYSLSDSYATMASLLDDVALRPFTIVQMEAPTQVWTAWDISGSSLAYTIRYYIITRFVHVNTFYCS